MPNNVFFYEVWNPFFLFINDNRLLYAPITKFFEGDITFCFQRCHS